MVFPNKIESSSDTDDDNIIPYSHDRYKGIIIKDLEVLADTEEDFDE